ncbi:hypothetical protein [Paenibacillus polysaccharolyticus]|uniref:hypothetical protein n=1 Tax=Paenibacillus polysaccharolyticus TaxID=582692 RepID=UPI0029595E8D|nr:hypothetical protein [Paenibacillus intestini]
MDIITYGKVVKLSNEVKDAREGNVTLDARLDKIESGTITVVNDKQGLPVQGVLRTIYAVIADEDHQNMPMLYTCGPNGYVPLKGVSISYKSNGILNIAGEDITVYKHPASHSADILNDGELNKVFTAEERLKLSGVEANANHYTHPDTHSADIIVDGETHVSMTTAERRRLSTIDPWEIYSDLVDYADVVTYFAFDEEGRIIRQVVTDSYTEQSVMEPMWTIPSSTDSYAENDAFLLISVGEVYRYDGNEFVQLSAILDAIYEYDDEGRMIAKSITTMGSTPIKTNYTYVYDSSGNRIAVKKYQG